MDDVVVCQVWRSEVLGVRIVFDRVVGSVGAYAATLGHIESLLGVPGPVQDRRVDKSGRTLWIPRIKFRGGKVADETMLREAVRMAVSVGAGRKARVVIEDY